MAGLPAAETVMVIGPARATAGVEKSSSASAADQDFFFVGDFCDLGVYLGVVGGGKD